MRKNNGSPTSTIEDLDDEICRYCRIVSQYATKPPKRFCNLFEQVACYYLDLSQFKKAIYDTGPLTGGVQGYSPTPRIEVAKILRNLVASGHADQFLDHLMPLFYDNNYTVRQIALQCIASIWHHAPDKFWKIITDRISKEENPVSLSYLIRAIQYDDVIDSNLSQVEQLAKKAIPIIHRTDARLQDLFHTYAVLLLKLLDTYNSSVGHQLIYDHLDNQNLSSALIFMLINSIDPHHNENAYESDPSIKNRMFTLLSDILNFQFNKLKGKNVSDLSKDDLEPIDQVTSQMYYTFVLGKSQHDGKKISPQRNAALYQLLKSIFLQIVTGSGAIESGFMVAHSGYNLVQLLGHYLPLDPSYILNILTTTVRLASANNFTYGPSALKEISTITEKILADHTDVLHNNEDLHNLLTLLDLFAASGWVEAMELIFRIRDAF